MKLHFVIANQVMSIKTNRLEDVYVAGESQQTAPAVAGHGADLEPHPILLVPRLSRM